MKYLITAIILTFSIITTFAQNTPMADPAPNNIPGADISENDEEESSTSKAEFVRAPKSLPADFTGFKIQLEASHVPLKGNHAIFQSFGNITLEIKGTQHCYSVGEFKSLKQAADFAKIRLGDKFPNYQVTQYEGGVRVAENVDFTAY